MTRGLRLRLPPRLLFLACMLALASALWAGPAGAYSCGELGTTRTLSAAGERDCRAPVRPRKAQRKTDVLSLALFVVALGAVLLVPLEYPRRRSAIRE